MPDQNLLHQVIEDPSRIRCLEPDLYSLYPPGENTNSYDHMGSFYDSVMCSSLYNRLVWGYSISHYDELCREALASSPYGWALDAGCGSLAFCVETYAEPLERPVVLLDQSVKLLKMAKARLIDRCGEMPDNLFLVHGNVLALPFKARAFESILCLNVLHVLPDVPDVLRSLHRVLDTDGSMHMTTLIRSGRWADGYMAALARTGEIIPRSRDEIVATFTAAGLGVDVQVRGSLATLRHRCSQTQARA